GSPAIDAGTNNQAPLDDFDWNFRNVDPVFDMGAFEYGGTPRNVKNSPSGKVADLVSAEVFTFRTPMDTTSFDLASGIVSFTGPGGAIAATGFAWLNAYQLQVTFPGQAVAGLFSLTLSPNLRDAGGHALGTSSTGTWTIVPPHVIHVT